MTKPRRERVILPAKAVQGMAALHTDPGETLRYARQSAKLRGVPEAELPTEPRQDAAYIRVAPQIAHVIGANI